jgi:hypothetical protein
MNLGDMLGLTTEEAIRIAVAAVLIGLIIGAHLWRRARQEQRVRIDLSSRRP